jgi:hypothetical protein
VNPKCLDCQIQHRVVVPHINLNGTAPQLLREDVQNALDAVREATRRLLAACPNGRDYQGLTGQASIALAEHAHRLEAIDRIQRDLEEILGHIQNVIDQRAEVAR